MRDVSQLPMIFPPSELKRANDVARTDSGYARTFSGEELAIQLIRWLKVLPVGAFLADCAPNERQDLTKASPYVDFRLTAQKALLFDDDDSEGSIVSSAYNCVRLLAGPGFDKCLSSILPNLKIFQRINNRDLQVTLLTLVSQIEGGVEGNELSFMSLTAKALAKKENAPRMSDPTSIESSTNQLVDSVKDLTLKKLSQVPLHRLERSFRLVLNAKRNHVSWFKEDIDREVPKEGGSEHENGMLILEMLDLLNVWRRDHGNLQQSSSLKERVEWTGRCALIHEYLMFIDPEFSSTAYLASLFEDKLSCNERPVFSIPKLALDFMIQNSSWQNISRILKVILGVFMKQNGDISERDMYLEKLQRTKVLDEASSVLEFILLCIRHPRTILACRLNEELDPFVSIYYTLLQIICFVWACEHLQ